MEKEIIILGNRVIIKSIDLTLKEVGKVIDKLIEDKRKIADKNLTSVEDRHGKKTTLYIYLDFLRDSIKQRLGIK